VQKSPIENVILITIDGVRTQEIFNGFDNSIPLTKPDFAKHFSSNSEEEKRKLLWPFLWGNFLQDHGFILGNRFKGNIAKVSNKIMISYPGYSELLTGRPHDDVISSNEVGQNPYSTICEFIKQELHLDKEGVAVFASWQPIGKSAEHHLGTITTNAGKQDYEYGVDVPALAKLNEVQHQTPVPFDDQRYDVFTFEFGFHFLKTFKPRFFYLAMGETDEWAHSRRYDLTVEAIQRTDGYLQQVWDFIQNDPQYKDKTAIVITTDHGRGDTIEDWVDHDSSVPGAEYIWIAGYTPHGKLRGEQIENDGDTFLAQIASTICRLLGLNYENFNKDMYAPLSQFFS